MQNIMSTRYYAHHHTQDYSERLVIATILAGYGCIFHYNEGRYYKNLKELKTYLSDKIITFETNGYMHPKELLKMARETKRLPNYAKAHPDNPNFRTIGGYAFISPNFYF